MGRKKTFYFIEFTRPEGKKTFVGGKRGSPPPFNRDLFPNRKSALREVEFMKKNNQSDMKEGKELFFNDIKIKSIKLED